MLELTTIECSSGAGGGAKSSCGAAVAQGASCVSKETLGMGPSW